MTTTARPVYAAHLRFDPACEVAASHARALTRHWLTQRFGGWPSALDPAAGVWVPAEGHRLAFRSVTTEGGRFWEATWEYPHDSDATLRWVLVVQVASVRVDSFAQVRLGLTPAGDPGRLSDTVGYDLTRPHLVHTIVSKLPIVDAGRRLTPGPWKVLDDTGIHRLAAMIADPARRLPVLVCSRTDGATEPEAPASSISDTCIGLAHVVDLTSRDLTFALTDLIGRCHSAHSGAMRLFWAGWSPTDPPHPLWTPTEMRADRFGSFGESVRRRLYAVAAFRVVEPQLIGQLERAAQRQRIAAARSEIVTQLSQAQETNSSLLEAWESDLLDLEKARLEVELLGEETEALRSENDLLRLQLEAASGKKPTPSEPSQMPGFASVADAVKQAARRLKNLEFHPRAFDSATECPYRWPDKIYEDLVLLDGIVGAWRETGRLPGGWAGAARQVGLNWAVDVSFTARTQYREDYEITFPDGTKAVLGPHLRRGAATGPAGHYRCYLHIDENARRVIVGYIGRHLRDRTSAA